MKAKIHIPKKTYVISVSLMKGCYRHIRIASNKTLDDLSTAILKAFDFDNDHLYAFFMDNKRWSDDDPYFLQPEYGERDAAKYKLAQVGLEKGKKFLYLFDFGDEWWFSCKVLNVIDDVYEATEVVRSVGEAPEQYPSYDDYDELYDESETDSDNDNKLYDLENYDDIRKLGFDDDDIMLIYPDTIYTAAFRFRDTKLWEKLDKSDVFAVKMSDGNIVYCSVTGNRAPHTALFVHTNAYGLYRHLDDDFASDETQKSFFEYATMQDNIICELFDKGELDPEYEEEIKARGKANGANMKGKKNVFPDMLRCRPECMVTPINNMSELKFLEESLWASVFISEELMNDDKASLGFGSECTIPLIEKTGEGYEISNIFMPEREPYPFPSPSAKKIKNKLTHSGTYECDVVIAPIPNIQNAFDSGHIVKYLTFFLAADKNDPASFLCTDLFDGYTDVADDMIAAVSELFKRNGFLPESINVIDERTEKLLRDLCDKNDIALTRADSFDSFWAARDDVMQMLADAVDDAFPSIISKQNEADEHDSEMMNDIVKMLSELPDEALASMPKKLYNEIIASGVLPEELEERLRRSRIKSSK